MKLERKFAGNLGLSFVRMEFDRLIRQESSRFESQVPSGKSRAMYLFCGEGKGRKKGKGCLKTSLQNNRISY